MGNTVELIKKYLQPVYVETGCAMGDGIVKAMEAGAQRCYGIECNPEFVLHCQKKFEGEKNIKILPGKSEKHLLDVIEILNHKRERALIFLDAHKVGPCKLESYPLHIELRQLGMAKTNSHTIMIDDIRLFDGELQIKNRDVLRMIDEINPGYKMVYEDSNTNEKDVLVAYL